MLYVIAHHEFSGAEISQAPVISADPDSLVACPPASAAERFSRSLEARIAPLKYRRLQRSQGPVETLRSVFRGLAAVIEVRRLLRRHAEHETIYAIGYRSALVASLAAIGLGRSVIWSAPDVLPPPPLRPLVRAVAWLFAARAICCSKFIADDLVRRSRRLDRLSTVIAPGVDLDRFDSAQARPGAACAALVGHVSPVKRTDLAIDIAASLGAAEPGFRLRVVGGAQFRDEDFELERELHERVATDPALAGMVEFAGAREGPGRAALRAPSPGGANVASTLAGCGMLLHCRPDEPFGMVLVEAMALGLPVVAPAGGGPLEIVAEGVTGLLYEPGDVADATRCLRTLIQDPELAVAMGAAARRRAEDHFAASRQVVETMRAISGLSVAR